MSNFINKKLDNVEYKYICIKKEFFDVNMIYLNYTNMKKRKYIEIIYKSPSIFLEGLFFKTPPLTGNNIYIIYKDRQINNITIKLYLDKNEFADFINMINSIDGYIKSYISRYVKLKRTGKRSVGLCPFHSEKSPSFSVSVDLQLFHCFGCGKSGDIFTFIQEYEKVDFKKSLEIISEYSGIPLQKFSNSEDAILKKKLYELNDKFLTYFKENLSGSEGLVARE